MLTWKKLGKVFDPTVSRPHPWMQEYAQCPTPFLLDENTVRVYISCRPQRGADLQYVSYPGYVDLARKDLTQVTGISPSPLLPLGGLGCFDEFGIMPCSAIRHGDEVYMYYTGWTRMSSVPYTLDVGLAISRDGGTTFEKYSPGPVLGLTLNEPYLVNTPLVRVIDGVWHMWYMTGRKWFLHEGRQEIVYQVAHASSDDGIQWQRDGIPIVPTLAEDECQDEFSPFFLGGKWHAVFAYRQPTGFRDGPARGYRLGYACSEDLRTWQRDDSQAGIALSESGWDSEMMCSSQAFEMDGKLYLFYCGNAIGREGFGIAELTGYSP